MILNHPILNKTNPMSQKIIFEKKTNYEQSIFKASNVRKQSKLIPAARWIYNSRNCKIARWGCFYELKIVTIQLLNNIHFIIKNIFEHPMLKNPFLKIRC